MATPYETQLTERRERLRLKEEEKKRQEEVNRRLQEDMELALQLQQDEEEEVEQQQSHSPIGQQNGSRNPIGQQNESRNPIGSNFHNGSLDPRDSIFHNGSHDPRDSIFLNGSHGTLGFDGSPHSTLISNFHNGSHGTLGFDDSPHSTLISNFHNGSHGPLGSNFHEDDDDDQHSFFDTHSQLLNTIFSRIGPMHIGNDFFPPMFSISNVGLPMSYEQLLNLQPVPTPANNRDQLPQYTFKKSENTKNSGNDCSICLTQYDEGDFVKVLPCAHQFHGGCIDRWLEENNTCPICKTKVDS